MIALKADPLAPFDDLLDDDGFWEAFEKDIAASMVPILSVIFSAGYMAGNELTPAVAKALPDLQPAPLDPGSIEALAEQAIRDYTTPFARSFTDTTFNGVRDAVLRARRDGTGIEGVLSSIEPMFGAARAQTVGVTETTRLFGLGAQANYRAQGINGWQWMSVNDPWVDAVCAGLAADSEAKPFPIDKLFEPAHPRCRCFPAPVLIDEPVLKENPYVSAQAMSSDQLPPFVETSRAEERAKGDVRLASILEKQGFMSPANVYTRAEIDGFVASGERELLRGVTKREFANSWRTSQGTDPYTGLGYYGNGIYAESVKGNVRATYHAKLQQLGSRPTPNQIEEARVSTMSETGGRIASNYAGTNRSEASIIRMTIRPEARVIEYDDLQEMIEADHGRFGTTDPSQFAAAKGYDIVQVSKVDYTIILNRSAVRIQDDLWTFEEAVE